jgi:hypothetical protein
MSIKIESTNHIVAKVMIESIEETINGMDKWKSATMQVSEGLEIIKNAEKTISHLQQLQNQIEEQLTNMAVKVKGY